MGATMSMCSVPATSSQTIALEHVQQSNPASLSGAQLGSGGSPKASHAPTPTAAAQSAQKAAAPATGGSPSSVGGAGLASRRNFTGKLQVATQKKEGEGEKVVFVNKKIKWCNKLSDSYELGSEVMPSCHTGMQVLFGKQKGTNLPVVIKVRSKRTSFKEGEEKEWRMSTDMMLNLPPSGNIAKLYEVLEDVEAYYVVMERCSGQDLFESLHSQAKLNIDEVKDIMNQILTALADLHEQGIIHKDLKLENVMLDRTPSPTGARRTWSGEDPAVPVSPLAVKLVDFDTVEEYIPQTPKRTKDVLGTDQYIAQEAYNGQYSPASDMFAVGVIGYRLLVGRFPFDSRMFNDKPGENWVGSPKMKEIRDKLCNFKINWDHKVFKQEPTACDLLKSMLAVRDSDRPTAKEALQHRWLQSLKEASTPGDPGASVAPLPNCVQQENSSGAH